MFKSPDNLQESKPTLSQEEILKKLYSKINLGLDVDELLSLATQETIEKVKNNIQPQIKKNLIYRLRKRYDVEDYVPLATEQTLDSIKEDVDLRHIKVAEIFNDCLQKAKITSIEKRPGLEHIID